MKRRAIILLTALALTVEETMALGYALSTAAGAATRFNITDDGQRAPLVQRLQQLRFKP